MVLTQDNGRILGVSFRVLKPNFSINKVLSNSHLPCLTRFGKQQNYTIQIIVHAQKHNSIYFILNESHTCLSIYLCLCVSLCYGTCALMAKPSTCWTV